MAFVDPLPSGTITLFKQDTTIVGWTKLTTDNDCTLRVVAGTASKGGSVNFTSVFSTITLTGTFSGTVTGTGATSLTVAQIPSHTHGNYLLGTTTNTSFSPAKPSPAPALPTLANGNTFALHTGTSLTATASGHTHPATGTISASINNASVDFSVKYVDMIQAQKD